VRPPSFSCFASKAAGRGAGCWRAIRWAGFRLALVIPTLLLAAGLASAQDRTKPKVPVIDKISSGGSRQAFNGIVQSLDEKRNILNINAVEGGVTEIFPIKKGTRVFGRDGSRLKLGDLTPGANVIVYFELRADHRTVKRIEILASESKKQAPPS
jgi:hypothetical protein